MVDKSQETTHFGFQTVAKEQKADMVAHVFHSVASKYDVMNDLMSLVFIVCGSDSRLIAAAYAVGKPCSISLVAPAT